VQVERLSNMISNSTGSMYLAVLLSGYVVVWLHQSEWSPLCHWAVEEVWAVCTMCVHARMHTHTMHACVCIARAHTHTHAHTRTILTS